ncbi:hypothetical protein Nepgr_008863 [Nepenthes gracilis]|uniref:MATH domain-containing protein n=1 Tax=Nepenthes gracilis TaxID=150966 RepID=A0AAD3S9F4_NEPGR|nr:hypothetical protein Nepgr_008863 [Nepenthes gracilis]
MKLKHTSSSEAVPVSSFTAGATVTSSDHRQSAASTETSKTSPPSQIPVSEDPAAPSTTTGGQESIVVQRYGDYFAVCRRTLANFPKIEGRMLWSKYFEVGGFDCRLLVYPKGDSQALPGCISIYLQIVDPRGTSSSKRDCFTSYRLSLVDLNDESEIIHRD